jgi:purine-binding chemotaxis protein CheW
LDISKVRKKLQALNAEEAKKQSQAGEDLAGIAEEVKEAVTVQKSIPETIKDTVTAPPVPEALTPEEDTLPVSEIELIAFSVSNEEFAMRLSEMKEIIKAQTITAVPRSPKYLHGASFLRGRVLPVINLKERLSLKKVDEGRQKIIVMFSSKELIGVLATRIIDVIRVPETELLPPPSTLSDREKSFMEGVIKIGDRFISVLKIDKIAEMETTSGEGDE